MQDHPVSRITLYPGLPFPTGSPCIHYIIDKRLTPCIQQSRPFFYLFVSMLQHTDLWKHIDHKFRFVSRWWLVSSNGLLTNQHPAGLQGIAISAGIDGNNLICRRYCTSMGIIKKWIQIKDDLAESCLIFNLCITSTRNCIYISRLLYLCYINT